MFQKDRNWGTKLHGTSKYFEQYVFERHTTVQHNLPMKFFSSIFLVRLLVNEFPGIWCRFWYSYGSSLWTRCIYERFMERLVTFLHLTPCLLQTVGIPEDITGSMSSLLFSLVFYHTLETDILSEDTCSDNSISLLV